MQWYWRVALGRAVLGLHQYAEFFEEGCGQYATGADDDGIIFKFHGLAIALQTDWWVQMNKPALQLAYNTRFLPNSRKRRRRVS